MAEAMPRLVVVATVSVAISREARPQHRRTGGDAMAKRSSGGPTHRRAHAFALVRPHDCLCRGRSAGLSCGEQLAYTTGLRVSEAPGATPPPQSARCLPKQLRRGIPRPRRSFAQAYSQEAAPDSTVAPNPAAGRQFTRRRLESRSHS